MKKTTNLAGSTLIGLLIVAAIMAILAPIAVPNFLEAQTRARVSRVKADTRALATALEAYTVDHNSYPQPCAWIVDCFDPFRMLAYIALSAPVAYATTGILPDPFAKYRSNTDRTKTTREMAFSNPEVPAGVLDDRLRNSGFTTNRSVFLIQSFGPDFADNTSLVSFGPLDSAGNVAGAALVYAPTNGTVSAGDIYRITAPQASCQYYAPGPQ